MTPAIAEALIAWRRKGRTVPECADHANVSPKAVTNWLSRRPDPAPGSLLAEFREHWDAAWSEHDEIEPR